MAKHKVTIEYVDDKPNRVEAVVLSTQHNPDVEMSVLREEVKKHIIDKVIPQDLVDENTKYFINPSGSFVVGGSFGDSGTTGRKSFATRMADADGLAVAASRQKIQPRWIVRQRTIAGTSRKVLSLPAWRNGRKCKCRTRLEKRANQYCVDTFGTG